ncbi:MAG: T9SS type A sorting domain-containing protein [Bacteroidota bacterium]|nr:T9SS type A sorting domain-containing protein [Bacteroidota bacterium]
MFKIHFGLFLLLIILVVAIPFIINQLKEPKAASHKSGDGVPLAPSEEYFLNKHGIPTEDFLEHKIGLIEALVHEKNFLRGQDPVFGGTWQVQGPGNIGARINTIAVHPRNDDIIFVGLSQGGIFRTTNGGLEWEPVFDEQPNLSIGDIAFDPINTNTIYAGTGDLNGGFYIGTGNGLYRSTDGGNHWTNIGLSETRIISKVVVDPQNPNNLYVGSLGNVFEKNGNRGVYKSTNRGLSWNKIFYLNDSTGITELQIDPKNSAVLYAVSWNRIGDNLQAIVQGPNSHIYKTTDGGNNWTKLSGGLADTINGRIALAIYPKDPDILYARFIRNILCGNSGGQNISEIYKSIDQGINWTKIPYIGLPCDVLGGFGWYFGKFIINPNNPNDVMVLGVDLYRSYDSGLNWKLESPEWFTYEVHADKHDIHFLDDSFYLLATDGGLYKKDEFSGEWTDMENIPGTQLYRVAYNPHSPNLYYGGAQDNGSFGGNKNGINEWERIFGGDGFQMAFHPSDPLKYYVEYQNGNLFFTKDGGADYVRFTRGLAQARNWDFPIAISKHNAAKLIAGSDRIFINDVDTGANFHSISPLLTLGKKYGARGTPTITSLSESSIDSNIILAGSTNGNVFVTYNYGMSWDSISADLPAAYISCVKTSEFDINILYVTLSGQRSNDYSPKVFKSINRGKTWRSISSNLPALPVFDIFIYPARADSILFVGTDIGVYGSINGGTSWYRVGDNMPFIPVYDLELNVAKNELIAGTFARSIQTFDLNKIIKSYPVKVSDIALKNDLIIYPNPVREELIVEIPQINSDSKQKELRIYNMAGTEVFCSDVNENIVRLDVTHFMKGKYLINFRHGKIGRKARFVKN